MKASRERERERKNNDYYITKIHQGCKYLNYSIFNIQIYKLNIRTNRHIGYEKIWGIRSIVLKNLGINIKSAYSCIFAIFSFSSFLHCYQKLVTLRFYFL